MYFVTVERKVTKTQDQWQSVESLATKEVSSAALRVVRILNGHLRTGHLK